MIEGLTECRVFLENKYINEMFYEGNYRGTPCIVKCSTKCPWSIANEYNLASRLFACAPTVVEEPLAWGNGLGEDPDGRLFSRACAYVVTAKIAGPSLTQLLAQGLTMAQADGFARDLRTLARALRQTGVLHRDLFADNLLLGDDGHLKAIDFQLAVDRNQPREDPWVVRHWKFRYVVFGVNRELGLGVWNDFHALGKILARFPQTATVRAVEAELAAGVDEMTYADPPRGFVRIGLWLYGCSLRLQMILRGKKHRKYIQLENRWRTVRGKW